MKKHVSFCWFAFVILSLVMMGCAAQRPTTLCEVKIPDKILSEKVRIVGITLSLTNACFASLPEIPPGWFFKIDNDPTWRGQLEGQIIVGAAALNKSDAFFHHPILVNYPNSIKESRGNCRIILTTSSETNDLDPDNCSKTEIVVPLLDHVDR